MMDPTQSSSQFQFLQLIDTFCSPIDKKNLENSGYHSMESIAYANTSDLSSVPGICIEKAKSLNAAAYTFIPMGFITGTPPILNQNNNGRISTGSIALDSLIGGGIRKGVLTEVYGESSVGKSQLAFTLSVTSQIQANSMGGMSRVVFIDTCGAFRSCRIIQIAERFGISSTAALNQIDYVRVFDCDHLLRILQEASDLMFNGLHALVVIDSIGDVIRSSFPDNRDIWERQFKLGQILRKCQLLSVQNGVAVLLVNQFWADFNSNYNVKAVGGNVMHEASQTRFWMKKVMPNLICCDLIKSPNCPLNQANVRITVGGICDVG